jgi:hypothetical protein
MSVQLANAKWLDGEESGLLGQFASTRGYSDLIAAVESKVRNYPAINMFFERGVTEHVNQVRAELAKLVKATGDKDVASTAKALLELSDGQKMLIITNGAN